jgi:hypothetical protein
MLLPDNIAQTTEALEDLPLILNHRSIVHEEHEYMFQEKHTDVLPSLTLDTSVTTVTWWQARQFREDNEYLRPLVDQQRSEMQMLITEYNSLKGEYDREIANIHCSYQEGIAHYQQRIQEIVTEHDRLHAAYRELEERYQELFHNFQLSVEEEAQRRIMEAAQTVIQSPEKAQTLFQNLVKTIERQYRQEEDKHLAEALYLKREVYRMTQLLASERQHLQSEYQKLLAQRHTMREQAALRQKMLQSSLQARWKLVTVVTSLGFVASLVIFQFLLLFLFHVHLTATVSLAIAIPIMVCLVLSLVLAAPVGMLRSMYLHPRKKMSKQSA